MIKKIIYYMNYQMKYINIQKNKEFDKIGGKNLKFII